MRKTSFVTLVPVLVALAGCSDRSSDSGAASGAGAAPDAATPSSQSPGTSAEGAAKTFTFTGKQRIPVRLTMNKRDDGGQQTPIYGGYRPTVSFGDGDSAIDVVCAVDTNGLEFAPGATHDVDLRCTSAVTVHEDAMDFVVREGGREVGTGTVTP